MSQKFSPPIGYSKNAHIDSTETYKKMYDESLRDPNTFWGRIAEEFEWKQKWDKVKGDEDFVEGTVKWFEGGKLNITVNCLDRHLHVYGDKIAYIFEANQPGRTEKYSYRHVHEKVCQYGNFLRDFGVTKGDSVCFYVPMIADAVFLILACARIGAVHNIIFGGFGSHSIRQRIEDCGAKFVITANESERGTKTIPLKKIVDEALSEGCNTVSRVVVLRATKADAILREGRDVWFDDVLEKTHMGACEPEIMDAEDPLFILYTSGSTGAPKGVLHTVGGYMVFTYATLKYAFDIHEKDVFWCTADIGWVTGHSYIIYGPLLSATTAVVFDGHILNPDAGRPWQVVQDHGVTIFYTAPTLIRVLTQEGEKYPEKYDLSSLRLLGSVGEPISPEPWLWYYKYVGGERCPVIDTYWQTESGGFVIMPFPAAYDFKPGCAGRPFFGVEPVLLNDKGKKIIRTNTHGHLVFKHSWPGMMRGIYHHSEMFKEKYFSTYPGYYETGDGAHFDEDGDWWIEGRIDDVMKVSGHRIGTADVESALVAHEAVVEAAVVGVPHEIKGEDIYAYVVLSNEYEDSDELQKVLMEQVANDVGRLAKPGIIRTVSGLPKTRSGKIMRRILRKIAGGQKDDLGDISTLANPEIVDELLAYPSL